MSLWGIVPVKRLEEAKSSLAPVLGPAARRELVLAMLEDILRVLLSAPSIAGVIVTSPDDEVLRFAREIGAETVFDGHIELNLSIELAIKKAIQIGASSVLILPGDVPLVRVHDVENMASMVNCERAVVISPSKSRGTDALLIRPPDLINLRYGGESFPLHIQEALKAGVTPRIYKSHNLENDLDDPADIPLIAEESHGTKTYEVLIRAITKPYFTRR